MGNEFSNIKKTDLKEKLSKYTKLVNMNPLSISKKVRLIQYNSNPDFTINVKPA